MFSHDLRSWLLFILTMRNKTIFISICFSFSIIFISYILLLNVKENPISLIYRIENDKIFTFIPQGWAFFTKSPREFQLTIFKSSGKKLELINLKNVQKKYLFGLEKSNRVIHHKLLKVYNEIPNEHWTPIKEISKVDFNELNLYNVQIEELPYGNYLLIMDKTEPWAFHSKNEKNEFSIFDGYAISLINNKND